MAAEPFVPRPTRRSIRIGADDLTGADRVETDPDRHVDAVLDESDGTVSVEYIDATGMPAASPGEGRLIARESGAGKVHTRFVHAEDRLVEEVSKDPGEVIVLGVTR